MVSRKDRDCSTVNTGSCATVIEAMPSSSSRAKNVLRSAAIEAGVTSRVSAKGLSDKGLTLTFTLGGAPNPVLWTSEGRSTTTPDSAFKREPDGFGKCARVGRDRGCSSGVEHNLAKVGVVGSNPIARSNFLPRINLIVHAFSRSAWTVRVKLVMRRCRLRANPEPLRSG